MLNEKMTEKMKKNDGGKCLGLPHTGYGPVFCSLFIACKRPGCNCPECIFVSLNTKRTYKREAELFSLSITNPKGCRWRHLIGSLARPNGTCFRVEHSRILILAKLVADEQDK